MRSLLVYICLGQSMVAMSQQVELYPGDPSEPKIYHGYLDGSLPIEFSYQMGNEELTGWIRYGSDSTQTPLEGKIFDDEVILYEFDDTDVSGVLTGTVHDDQTAWSWSTHDYEITLPIALSIGDVSAASEVAIYRVADEDQRGLLIIDESRSHVCIQDEASTMLKWVDLLCTQDTCRSSQNQSGSVLMGRSDNDHVVMNRQRLESAHRIPVATVSNASPCYFEAFSYPDLSGLRWRAWIKTVLQPKQQYDQVKCPSDQESTRFERRRYGDFYLTLVSRDLVCGYLTFRDHNHSRVETIPFNYDRNKDQFFRLKDLFRTDYDYSFFLKK
ncbi:MAG: hypothetical protein AAFR14_09840, partial [Bacteroidota bacterium]